MFTGNGIPDMGEVSGIRTEVHGKIVPRMPISWECQWMRYDKRKTLRSAENVYTSTMLDAMGIEER